MSKFWGVAIVLLIGGAALVLFNGAEADRGISLTDLETECRYDRSAESNIDLRGNRLHFSGNFPTQNPDTALDYSYSVSDSEIRLNIITKHSTPLESFIDSCKASVIYDARTERLEEGRYMVKLLHDGKRQERMVLSVK